MPYITTTGNSEAWHLFVFSKIVSQSLCPEVGLESSTELHNIIDISARKLRIYNFWDSDLFI